MTDDRTSETPPQIGENLADAIADLLIQREHYCLRIFGKIGGQPNIRYQDGKWQVATRVGLGLKMTNDFKEETIIEAIRNAPRLELEPVSEMTIWEESQNDKQ